MARIAGSDVTIVHPRARLISADLISTQHNLVPCSTNNKPTTRLAVAFSAWTVLGNICHVFVIENSIQPLTFALLLRKVESFCTYTKFFMWKCTLLFVLFLSFFHRSGPPEKKTFSCVRNIFIPPSPQIHRIHVFFTENLKISMQAV